MRTPELIGETIRSIRHGQNKTLRQISKKSYVALGYLSEVERGHKSASPEILDNIADALGLTTAQLYRAIADTIESYS